MRIETAMDRIGDAADELQRVDDREQQFEMYRKTFRALEDIDGDDDDEGIAVVSKWIVEQIQTEEALPGSRAVRRRARQFCERNGYEISDNSWLGA